jgi:hypothetical protein
MSSLPALLLLAPLLIGSASLAAAPTDKKKPSAVEPGPRVVEPADRRAFYRDGWRALLGRRIHLHLEAEVLRHAPEKFLAADRTARLRFANRSVAIVVDPGTPEWRKAMEDRDDASEFCLHGTVRLAPAGTRGLAQLDVVSIKRAPGSTPRKAR